VLGGQIEVRSVPDQGTQMLIVMPCEAPVRAGAEEELV